MACEIVAELGNASNGDQGRMLRLIDAAKAAGADAVKLQCYDADELVAIRGDGPAPEPWGSQGFTMRSLYEKAATPWGWFPVIAAHCEKIGIPWFSSCFGPRSLAFLEACGCPRYKISHFEHRYYTLAHLARQTNKPVIASVPYLPIVPQQGEVYCPAGYPASPNEMHLTKKIWGLSSHCRHPLVAPLAIARGAQYLEYHFHLEAEPSELEANVSLNEREFAAMVQSVRDAEVLLG